YSNMKKAETYIERKLKSCGYTVEKQYYEANKKKVANLIVEKKGTDLPDEILVVGAHYDTCDNPGADDNASAVAGLLELAKMTAKKKTSRTVRFVAFANEEPPFFGTALMGSYVYSRSVRKKNENVRAALILEMIGYYSDEKNSQKYPPLLNLFYPNKGNYITVVGDLKNIKLVHRVYSLFKKHCTFPVESIAGPAFIPGLDFSDHWSFWKVNYPSVMLTDTSFYRNPHYHKKTDTYDTLNYDYLAEVVKGVFKVSMEMANKKK
ncbi:MAG: M28 family peptidase, partial [Spirochaetes bacterium]|nr:M28 family peptidase [Spirochaetota bacterium]